MPTWTLKADRRKIDKRALERELSLLAETVQGLQIQTLDSPSFDEGPDAGGFRDFAPFAHISHPHLEVLEIVAEELLINFGWLIDFQK